MDPERFTRRPKKARKWLRTREIERLRVLNLQLDIQALRTEIRSLEVTRSLLLARERRQELAETQATPDQLILRHRRHKLMLKIAPPHISTAENPRRSRIEGQILGSAQYAARAPLLNTLV